MKEKKMAKIKGQRKKFLILAGASAAGFFVFSVLHNFLYAGEVLTKHWPILPQLFGCLHAACFLIAVIACPIGFLIGVIGSLVSFLKFW
mgnify:CR=1 FL=1